VLTSLLRVASIASAYKAKVLCSGVFVSHRQPESILDRDLSDDIRIKAIKVDVDRQEKTVTSSLWGIPLRKAIFRPELGCTLAIGTSLKQLRSQAAPLLEDNEPLSTRSLDSLPTKTITIPSRVLRL